MATIRGEAVDRPPFCFYEINGLDEQPDNPDPYNIFNHPSWKPVIDLAREHTDRIVMRTVPFHFAPDPLQELSEVESWIDASGSLFTRTTLKAGSRALTSLTRRDRDVNTIWTVKPLLENEADLCAYLDLPQTADPGEPDLAPVLEAEATLGDTGIVLIDTSDPLCEAAQLFEMGTYLLAAYTRPDLFRRLLERFAEQMFARTKIVSARLPGRLWRIYGPEYASPPYLPPRFFRDYVVEYDQPLVGAIHANGGFARLHCHGRLRQILDDIAATGCVGLDPIEPPPQGDVSLAYVRQNYGRQMVLFGNLEASELETLPTPLFRKRIRNALQEGTAGEGRGFVLMPSACPYGRRLAPLALANYLAIVEEVESFK